MWQRRLAGRVVSPSPHPPITSSPEQVNNGDVLSAGEGERIRDLKRGRGGRPPFASDVVTRMMELHTAGMSLRKISAAVASEFRRPVMPATSVARIVRRTTRAAA
jgi:hypothetical protein